METSISPPNSRNSRKRNTAGKPTGKSLSAPSARRTSARSKSKTHASAARAAARCSKRIAAERQRRRDTLIVEHLALVTSIAQRLAARLPPQIELDDLASAGHVGLCEAADAFDAARGVPFGAYARRRIVGSMLDWLRASDPLTRHARARVRSGDLQHFEIQLHLDDAEFVRANGLDKLAADTVAQDAILAELLQAAHVRSMLDKLPKRERAVLHRYFWLHEPLAVIGRALGVGDSRVSQLKKQACDRLRRLLAS